MVQYPTRRRMSSKIEICVLREVDRSRPELLTGWRRLRKEPRAHLERQPGTARRPHRRLERVRRHHCDPAGVALVAVGAYELEADRVLCRVGRPYPVAEPVVAAVQMVRPVVAVEAVILAVQFEPPPPDAVRHPSHDGAEKGTVAVVALLPGRPVAEHDVIPAAFRVVVVPVVRKKYPRDGGAQ